jgi:hypothetical protein
MLRRPDGKQSREEQSHTVVHFTTYIHTSINYLPKIHFNIILQSKSQT